MIRRVTFVLPSLHGGGAERAAVLLINELAVRGYDATLYLFSKEGAYFDQLASGVRVVVGKTGRAGRIAALRRFLASTPQHVVVSFLSHFTVFAAVRTSGAGAKYVISQQTPLSAFLGDEDYAWRQPLRRRLFTRVARAVYPRADAIAATSQGVEDDLVKHFAVPRGRVAIVHNPVDVATVQQRSSEPLERPLPEDGVPTIVTAGRLAHAKNLPLLVEALELLAPRVAFRAWILGQGELEGALRAAVARAGLERRVSLLGFQSNPWKYMARADVFVLTSRYEGFGNVLIEAMAAGLPVVATASHGTREIVRHETNGLLVESHQAASVADALERVLTDVDFRRALARGARESAPAYAVPRVADRLEALIGRLLEAA